MELAFRAALIVLIHVTLLLYCVESDLKVRVVGRGLVPSDSTNADGKSPDEQKGSKPPEKEDTSKFSTQAVIFLVFVAVCLILLIVFFLYLNKMFCFKNIGGFPCVDQPPKKRFDATTGREYGIGDDDDDEDDSDDEALLEFQRQKSLRMSAKDKKLPAREDEITPADNAGKSSEPDSDMAVSAMAAAVEQMSGSSQVQTVDADSSETRPILGIKQSTENSDFGIEISCLYMTSRGELTISVREIKNTPSAESSYQVHVTVLPAKKYLFRSNYVKGGNPYFFSNFNCRIRADALADTYVRFRVYCRANVLAPAKLVGAAIVSLSTLPKDKDTTRWTILQPSEEGLWAVDMVDGFDQSQQLSNTDPQVQIGLSYSSLTGRLTCDIGQAQALHKLLQQVPPKLETYIKVLVMLGPSADRLLAQTKTRVNKGFCPSYKEKFVFQIAQFQLADISLGIMFYTRRRQNIGWLAIGAVAERDSAESMHWADLKSNVASAATEMITRYHVIRPPEQLPKDGSSVSSSASAISQARP